MVLRGIMQEFLQYVFSGVTNGSVYAIIALGFSMLFGMTGLINFAQGEFVMLGALGMISLWKGAGLPLPAAIVLSTIGVSAVGLLLERAAIRNVRKPHPIVLVIVTIGASIFLRGAGMIGWGKESYSSPAFSRQGAFEVAGATLLPQSLFILGAVLLIVFGLQFFYRRTLTGKAMLACAISKRAAWLQGIPSERLVLLAFALSAGMGAIGGILIAPISMSSYDMGMTLGLKGFCAAMLGGLGSSLGAVLGGLLLGLLEAFGVGFFSSSLKDAIAFVLLLGILYVRPGGILGAKVVKRF
ncbi:MAG TPA: branched-chain amino acid ABC transporter permease [Syntrophobacter fumaroxidans]|nr:branched-chain amino acid ABC transporter permease [Syntrophobacter fumaroxidans]